MLDNIVEERYKSYTEGIGLDIVQGKIDFHQLEDHALGLTEIKTKSGRLEQIKATINQYLLQTYAGE